MVVLSELWIGDLLKLRRSGRVGKFEGIKDGKAKINVSGKIVLSRSSNLEPYTEEKKPIFFDLDKKEKYHAREFDRIIDLHIETLNPSLLTNRVERIVDYQIKAAKTHIELAITRKELTIEIIHGKGTGVLRSEILHLLSMYSEVNHHISTRSGGGTEVWFKV